MFYLIRKYKKYKLKFISLKQIKIKDIRISNNEEYTCLKIDNEIIVHSNKLGIPITSFDSNDGIYHFA